MLESQKKLSTTRRSSEYSLYLKCISATMNYIGEILLVVLLIVTSYANLQKGALKIQLQPQPVRFFGENTTTRDFYTGDIATAFTAVLKSDISLVMYYAPWDFDSQLTRIEFEKVAQQYGDQVQFSAINCWIQNGACRQTFPKLKSFPLILGYVGGSKGIHYRGPLQYKHINEFVQHLIKPLERIETSDDLYRLMTNAIGVVTGYFNFDAWKPEGFYAFYVASLRYLEHDPYRSIVFAAITNPSAARMIGIRLPSSSSSVQQHYDIRLHLWNETLIYPNNGTAALDGNKILHWIYYRTHSPIQWIRPSSRKNQAIQHYFVEQTRPALILFTPWEKPSSQVMLIKEVALRYNDCGYSSRIGRLVHETQYQRSLVESTKLSLEKKCGAEEREHLDNSSSIWMDSQANGINDVCSSSSHWIPPRQPTVQGLACRTNHTLNFYIMDSEQYPNFMLKLGYTLKEYRRNPSVVYILDLKDESHYVLNEPITTKNVESLILNFTENSLNRFRRSQTHALPCAAGRTCIQEVSANNFRDIVLDSSHHVIVFYRKSGCVFCETGTRSFLRLSQIFSPTSRTGNKALFLQEIKFVSIDADQNDLDWQFTVVRYPSVIFYPASRKSESRFYPHDLEFSLVNLLNFTLSQLGVKDRITWFIHLCEESACLHEAQQQIAARLVVIRHQLRIYRYRVRWPENRADYLVELRNWTKERQFFTELNAVVERELDLICHSDCEKYPDGVRFATQHFSA